MFAWRQYGRQTVLFCGGYYGNQPALPAQGGLTKHLLPTAQPWLKFGGVLPAKLVKNQGGIACKIGV